MLSKDLKKGMRVVLKNGWYATMADNMRGSTRMATVEGIVTETGSVYAADIYALVNPDGTLVPIEHTKKELDVYELSQRMYGI